MANYVKATNFAVKDSLGTSDPAKIIKGTEIDNEYNAVASAVSSKADSNSPTLTGTPLAPTAAPGTNTTQIATTAFVTAATGNATNIAGGGANRIVYQSALDTTDFAVAPTVAGTYLGWTGSAFAWSTVSASTSAALTMNNSGTGDSSGATFNGSIAKTISYNTIGAPSVTGTGASGTWGISITGSSGSTAFATSAGSVTNGLYTNVSNTLSGSGAIAATGTAVGDQRFSVSFSGYSTGMSPQGMQIGASGKGIINDGTYIALGGISGGTVLSLGLSAGVLISSTDNTQKPSGGSWLSSSDSRLKENINPYTKGLDAINSLRTVTFTLKENVPGREKYKIDSTKVITGIIAQEVLETPLASIISEGSDGYYMVDPSELTWTLVNAIKELKTELDVAKQRISALENA